VKLDHVFLVALLLDFVEYLCIVKSQVFSQRSKAFKGLEIIFHHAQASFIHFVFASVCAYFRVGAEAFDDLTFLNLGGLFLNAVNAKDLRVLQDIFNQISFN